MLVVEHGGPTMFARIGVMRTLNRGHVREFNTSRKEPHWGGESSRGTNEVLFAHSYTRPNPVCRCRRPFAANGTPCFAGLKHDRLDLRRQPKPPA
jgi:hypothetical protein